jgi:hypothetical protein
VALTADVIYQAVETFIVSDGSKPVTIHKGDLRLGVKTEAANSEPYWIAAGSTDAEVRAARIAAGLEGE